MVRLPQLLEIRIAAEWSLVARSRRSPAFVWTNFLIWLYMYITSREEGRGDTSLPITDVAVP